MERISNWYRVSKKEQSWFRTSDRATMAAARFYETETETEIIILLFLNSSSWLKNHHEVKSIKRLTVTKAILDFFVIERYEPSLITDYFDKKVKKTYEKG